MAVEFMNNSSALDGPSKVWSASLRPEGSLIGLLVNRPAWQYVVTFLIGVVVYDQGNL